MLAHPWNKKVVLRWNQISSISSLCPLPLVFSRRAVWLCLLYCPSPGITHVGNPTSSLLCPRLSRPRPLSHYSQGRCSSPFIVFVALHWAQFSKPISHNGGPSIGPSTPAELHQFQAVGEDHCPWPSAITNKASCQEQSHITSFSSFLLLIETLKTWVTSPVVQLFTGVFAGLGHSWGVYQLSPLHASVSRNYPGITNYPSVHSKLRTPQGEGGAHFHTGFFSSIHDYSHSWTCAFCFTGIVWFSFRISLNFIIFFDGAFFRLAVLEDILFCTSLCLENWKERSNIVQVLTLDARSPFISLNSIQAGKNKTLYLSLGFKWGDPALFFHIAL